MRSKKHLARQAAAIAVGCAILLFGAEIPFRAERPTEVSRKPGFRVVFDPPSGWINPLKFRRAAEFSGGSIAQGWVPLGVSLVSFWPVERIGFYGGSLLPVGSDGQSSEDLLASSFPPCASGSGPECVSYPVQSTEEAVYRCDLHEEDARQVVECHVVSKARPAIWAGFSKDSTKRKAGRDYAQLSSVMQTVRFLPR
jgi:hypothetical protein